MASTKEYLVFKSGERSAVGGFLLPFFSFKNRIEILWISWYIIKQGVTV